MPVRAVGGNYGSRFAQSVPLVHRKPDCVVEFLQVFIEQRTTTDEELQLSTEVFADFREKHAVEQAHERFQQEPGAASLVFSAVSIIDVGHFEGKVEQTGDMLALGTDALFDILFEVLGQCRDAQDQVRLELFDVDRNVL